MPNLSSLLEDSAGQYADREAVVLGDTRLTYAQVNGAANQVANLLVVPRHPARRQGGAELPQPALLPDRLLRHPQGRGDRRAAQRAAQGPRGGLPPRRLGREGLLLLPGHRRAADRPGRPRGLRGHRGLRALLHDHRRPDGRLADRGHRDARPGDGRPAADVRDRRRRRRRHRRHPLHLRHHRPAQGRRAAAPQHALQRDRRQGPLRRRRRPGRTPTCACCRSSTPSARPSSRTAASPTAAPW